jgi:hypothetical protein
MEARVTPFDIEVAVAQVSLRPRPAACTRILAVCVAVFDRDALSLTWIVKLLVVSLVALGGVPDITPPDDRLKPDGKEPAETDHA